MPAIYTAEWCEALKDLLNRNPEVQRHAPRGGFDALIEIKGDARSCYLAPGERRNFTVRLEDGRCAAYHEVAAAPARKGFDFVFEMPASIFEGVAAGLIDLVDAGLKGLIRITGDMRILIRHAELVNVLYRVYTKEVETLWPKGRPATAAEILPPARGGN